MKSLSSYLLFFFAILFWIFRVVVALMDSLAIEFFAQPMDITLEIAILFVTMICLVLIMKRNIIGSTGYLISYVYYFGTDLYNTIMLMTEHDGVTIDIVSTVISALALILATAIFIDVLRDMMNSDGKKNKKTDWFYKNEQFDRKMDERADKNNYRLD